MIRILSLCLSSTLFLFNIQAQGIYKTASDYTNNNLAYEDHTVRADLAFNSASVKVTKGSETLRFNKNELFGFRNSKEQDFRFFKGANYRIIMSSPFFIYSREENIVKGKAKTRETRYYFSTEENSGIAPLSRLSMKKAYPDNRAFHDLLDVHFRSDHELLKFDAFHKEYTLVHLFRKSMK